MKHHTKDKGDLGVALVIADLIKAGIKVCLPISEHLPFDLIAVSEELELKRIQVKFRSTVNESVNVAFQSVYNDKSGTHYKPTDLSKVDIFAVCCLEKQTVHYIKVSDIKGRTMTIRLDQPKNNQVKKIRLWESSIDPLEIFSE